MNEILFPIIRNKFPSTIADDLTSVLPIELPEPAYGPWKRKIVIQGGHGHSYLEGFFFQPYSLVLIEIRERLDPITNFTIVPTRTIEVLEEGLSEEEFEKVKDKWERRISEYERKKFS